MQNLNNTTIAYNSHARGKVRLVDSEVILTHDTSKGYSSSIYIHVIYIPFASLMMTFYELLEF